MKEVEENIMGQNAVDFLYLSEPDMVKAGVTDMPACVDTMVEMFKSLSAKDYVMGGANHNSHGVALMFPEQSPFPNMPVDGPDRRFMAMPAYLGGDFDIAGMKWYGSNIENKEKGLPRSILMLMLNDKDTGAPVSLMSANLVSAYRTGAIPGVGAKYMARPNSRVLGIIGPGVMNKTALTSFMYACPKLDTIKIKGHGQKSIDAYIEFIQENYPQIKEIEVVDTLEEAVRGCDIVSVAASVSEGVENYPYIKEEWIKKGAFLSLPANVRFDDDFLINRARLVADNSKLYEAWEEEYPHPAYESVGIIGVHFMDLVVDGKLKRSKVEDLGDIIAGKTPARQSDEEIVVFSIGGMPVEDLAWGLTVYRNAREMGLGIKLNLWDTPAMA